MHNPASQRPTTGATPPTRPSTQTKQFALLRHSEVAHAVLSIICLRIPAPICRAHQGDEGTLERMGVSSRGKEARVASSHHLPCLQNRLVSRYIVSGIPSQLLLSPNDFGKIKKLSVVAARGAFKFDILVSLLEVTSRTIESKATFRLRLKGANFESPLCSRNRKLTTRSSPSGQCDCSVSSQSLSDNQILPSDCRQRCPCQERSFSCAP